MDHACIQRAIIAAFLLAQKIQSFSRAKARAHICGKVESTPGQLLLWLC